MNRFLDLMDQIPVVPGKGPFDKDFSYPRRLFPGAVADSPLHLWSPGDPVATTGIRVLIGVATWSGYDMRLLDVIEESIAAGNTTPQVDVFDTDALRHVDEFQAYIPGVGGVVHTPAVGIWRDGVLTAHGEGFQGRDLVARLFGSSAVEIGDFVQTRLNDRLAALRAS